jgi:integrase
MAQLKAKLIDLYSEDDKDYSEKAMSMINDHFSDLKKSTSKIDPDRLGSRSTFISRLKMAILEKLGPVEVDGHPKFNELSIKEQIKFQKRAELTGLEDWVHKVKIIPGNLAGLKMPDLLSVKLKEMRETVNNGKLEAEMLEIDADRMLAKLCPVLEEANPKRHYLAAALLAATGRRTIEVLKLGKLYLGPDQTPDGYSCWFEGQAKQGLNPTRPYVIPLLAPFSLVKAALTRVREMYDTEDITEQTVNSNLSKSIANYTQKVLGVTPHALRSIYAMSTYKLLKQKISLIGHIRKVLGHSDGTSASHYQRMDVTITDVWQPTTAAPVEEEEAKDDWVINGAVEKKRFEGIREMMASRLRLTATAIRSRVGGTIPVLQRILDNNKDRVDEYNNSLTEEETKRIRRD